jgi:hypothetical protein
VAAVTPSILAGLDSESRSSITRLFVVARWTPGEVQRYLGHMDPRVTLAIYTHIAAEDPPAPPSMSRVKSHAKG